MSRVRLPLTRAVPTAFVSLVLASIVACGGGGDGGGGGTTAPPDNTPRVISVSVTPASPTIGVGEQVQLSAAVAVQNGAAQSVNWSSSNTAVATVTAGLVRGVAAGTANIVATSTADASKTGTVTVIVAAPGSFPATASVSATPNSTFEPPTVDIARGGTVTWAFGNVTHNVTFGGGAAPANIGSTTSASASRTFATAGTYQYTCTLHAGMNGTVIVH